MSGQARDLLPEDDNLGEVELEVELEVMEPFPGFNFSEFAVEIDRRGENVVHMFTQTGLDYDELSRDRRVCLFTQSSVDRLFWLMETTETWSGPVSVAVFTPDLEFEIGRLYVQFLARCFPRIAKQVAFHFVYPLHRPFNSSAEQQLTLEGASCDQPKQALERLLRRRGQSMLEWREPYDYPFNLMRNVGRDGCRSEYTYILDIDMIPVRGLDLHLETFVDRPEIEMCGDCAFVVPTYEISYSAVRYPESKRDLLNLVATRRAQVFHFDVWRHNQGASELYKWEKLSPKPDVNVAYRVQYRFYFEPTYFARGDLPEFNERFTSSELYTHDF